LLNRQSKEDPIDTILLGSDDVGGTTDDFIDLVADYQGPDVYGYIFDGQFDISQLAAGVCIITIEGEQKIVIKRMIKK
jgi:hypothetical protein